ncbi:hypothetical protein LY78DRAFT_230604 [Colletotrichum sublineola]|nr:hypothetical protein LY78DRAFT_230604 [Colletotrichum sublineola]
MCLGRIASCVRSQALHARTSELPVQPGPEPAAHPSTDSKNPRRPHLDPPGFRHRRVRSQARLCNSAAANNEMHPWLSWPVTLSAKHVGHERVVRVYHRPEPVAHVDTAAGAGDVESNGVPVSTTRTRRPLHHNTVFAHRASPISTYLGADCPLGEPDDTCQNLQVVEEGSLL